MEVLTCPRCLEKPEVIDGEPLCCCGILAADARLWNNYAYAMRIALTISYSKYTKEPVDNEELDHSWVWFDETYKEKTHA